MTRIADELKAGYKDGDPRRSAIAWLDGERQPVLAGIALDMLYLAHADNARLRALLADARPLIMHNRVVGHIAAHDEPDSPCIYCTMVARIDAALGGGAPCATCDGTGWVPAPNNSEFGWLHASRPCPDCDRSALPCDHPEDRRFYNGPTVTCEDCLAMGNVFEGDTLPDRIVQWVTE